MSAVDAYKLSFIVRHCFLAGLLVAFPAIAQNQPETRPAYSVLSSGFSNQNFYCHAGYTPADCQQQIAELKVVLVRYPTEELAPWTWVLVRSQDWIPIVQLLGLRPNSPAFTALDQRETFLEEALFKRQGLRSAELQQEWLMPRDQLLDLAVTHELGHALCSEPNEVVADHIGEELRRGHRPRCRSSKVHGYTPIRTPDTAPR
jgi:hypothetical protein